MGIVFTPDQQKVIDTRDRNILVAAAAGSGKTAVLVERIVQMVTDSSHPIDIDRLLIVTFTSAAASEMRERISNALMKKIDAYPGDEHLQKQMTLIHNAQITTIDSFCLFIIRNHFNDIGLDPGFRVADEGELQLLRQDVLAALLEERFAEKQEAFYHCVECYSTNSKEKALEEHILQLYQFAMSYPFPEKWLQTCKADYQLTSIGELEQTKWMQDMKLTVLNLLKDCLEQLEEAIRVCEQPDGPYMYIELLENEKKKIENILEKTDYRSLYAAFSELAFDRLPVKKDDSVSKDKRELAKNIRNAMKDVIQMIKSQYFWISPEQVLEDIRASEPAVSMLIELTLQFMEKLAVQKREKNIVDFGDMEHFALQILLQEQEGTIVPTKTALGYQEYFEEILIDEYQDSNLVQEYLLRSVSKEKDGVYNRFMVGDVKQSIYKFRLARPELFMEKYHAYKEQTEQAVRIDLKQNFRSRKEVIESVNFIFRQIMIEGVGGVSYDADAALYLGATYPETEEHVNQTELLLVETGEELQLEENEEEKTDAKPKKKNQERSKRELEALAIAKRIKELVGGFQVTDKETGALRTASYRDIVILLRSNAGWDETFREILQKEGIPTYITSKTGYFSSIEIQSVLHFLRIVDNPLQDIPLCAVLRTPVFGFSDEDLAKIRIHYKKSLLYDALLNYAESGENRELQKKITVFIELLERYRQKVTYTPIHELIHTFMQEVGLYHYMSALPAGEQRKANMDKLLEKAIDFEKTSYHGLFHFIRYMEQMQKYNIDVGEANIQDENADVVRVMSIHKSKGLEFPICFVAGMAKRFNMQDTRKPLVMDMTYGIGADYMNAEERYKTPTLCKNVIAARMQQENIGEELRILYVALTRAKEKLIMTGTVDDMEKKIAGVLKIQQRSEEQLSLSIILGMNSYLDNVLAALIRHRAICPLLDQYGIAANTKNTMYANGPDMQITVYNAMLLAESNIRENVQKSYLQKLLGEEQLQMQAEHKLVQAIDEKFSYQYPHAVLARLYTKTTVSELKKMGQTSESELGKVLFEEQEVVPYIPKFMREQEEMLGTTRGSAYHRVLELLNLEDTENELCIEKQLQKLVEEGRLQKEYKEAVNVGKILQFTKTNLAERMRNAQKQECLYREQPFVLGVPANQIEEEFPKEESILVQGIIDVYFEEEGGLIVADYKTDKVEKEEELWKRYKTQLDYYAEALEQLVGLPVKQKIIYSFALGKESICK